MALLAACGGAERDASARETTAVAQAAAQATPVASRDPSNPWLTYKLDTNQMDGTLSPVVMVIGESATGGGVPQLFVRCVKGETSAYVVTTQSVYPEGDETTTRVRVRINEDSARAERWTLSSARIALFSQRPVALARELAKAKVFRLEYTPTGSAPLVARFDTQGLEQHLPKIAAACHWKL